MQHRVRFDTLVMKVKKFRKNAEGRFVNGDVDREFHCSSAVALGGSL